MSPAHLWRAAAVLAALTAPSYSTAAQTGSFIVRLGADTVQIERFTRTPSSLEGTLVQRTPSLRIISYSLTFGPDGAPQRYKADARNPDGTPSTLSSISGTFTYLRDSVVRETMSQGQPVVQRIAAANVPMPAPNLPYLGVSPLMYEMGFAQAKKLANGANESGWYVVTFIPGLPVQRTRTWIVGSDSAEADYFGVARSGYKFDAEGRIIRMDWSGTTYRYRGERIPAADVDAIARAWAEDEKRGKAIGAVSPRDTVRGTIGGASLAIEYSRPSKRGRVIWGDLVPYNQVWRLGADVATHFSTSAALRIGETIVPAGRYTLWMQPTSDSTAQLIINSRINIFGTGYSAVTDYARVPLRRAKAPESAERLTIGIASQKLTIQWDDVIWTADVTPGTPTRESVLAADRLVSEWSAQRGFRDAINGELAGDGTLLYAGAPVVQGAKQIAELLAAQPLLDSVVVRWQPLTAVTSRDGMMALTYGLTVTLPRAGQPVPRMGNYAHVWMWTNGAWRLAAALHANVIPPARTVIPPSFAIELPALAETGSAKAFVSADLAFTKLTATTNPANAFRTYAATDAVLFAAGNELVRGSGAIGDLFAGGPAVDWTWHPVVAGAAPDGSFGFTVGESMSRLRGQSSSAPNASKYLSVWRRDASGAVRYVFDGGNPRPLPGQK